MDDLANQVTTDLGGGLRFRPEATTNPLFTTYPTADGWIAIAALRRNQWPDIARAVDLEHLLDDPRFVDLFTVIEHRDDFRPLFAAHLATRPTAHWCARLRAADIWVAPVNTVDDLADDPQVQANEYLVTFDDGFVGPPTPFEVDDWRGTRGQAAQYGEHTDEVLEELGYADDEILALKAAGAIW